MVTKKEFIAGLIIGALFVFVFLSSGAFGAEYEFTTIATPSAYNTFGHGINDAGDVVGMLSECSTCFPSPFLLSDGQYYDIGVSGASLVIPFGINRDGMIAGTLVNGSQYAFIMDEVNTTILDQAVRADAINGENEVVGYMASGTFNQLAYRWGQQQRTPANQEGVYIQLVTTAEVPGILGSAATGINDKGDIVGYWFHDVDGVNVKLTGFMRKVNGTLTPLPDSFLPLGINQAGQIVGTSGAGFDGAIFENSIVTFIQYPDADYTQVRGINNRGVLVGYYLKAGKYYGFTATAKNGNGAGRRNAGLK